MHTPRLEPIRGAPDIAGIEANLVPFPMVTAYAAMSLETVDCWCGRHSPERPQAAARTLAGDQKAAIARIVVAK